MTAEEKPKRIVSTVFNGVALTGIADGSTHFDTSVTLTEPFAGFVMSLALSRFFPPAPNTPPLDERVRGALVFQYEVLQRLRQHRKDVIKRLRRWDVEADFLARNHDGAPEVIAHDRRALRTRFKAGQLTQRAYQQQLEGLRQRQAWYREDVDAAFERTFAAVQYNTRLDLMRRIADEAEASSDEPSESDRG